jgi:hypothetical protein
MGLLEIERNFLSQHKFPRVDRIFLEYLYGNVFYCLAPCLPHIQRLKRFEALKVFSLRAVVNFNISSNFRTVKSSFMRQEMNKVYEAKACCMPLGY